MQMKMRDFKYVITMVGRLTSIEYFWGITDDNKVYYCSQVMYEFQTFKAFEVELKGKLYDVNLELIDFDQCKGHEVAFTPPEVSVFKRKNFLFNTKMKLVYKGYALDPNMFRVIAILMNMKDGLDIQQELDAQVSDMIDAIAYEADIERKQQLCD